MYFNIIKTEKKIWVKSLVFQMDIYFAKTVYLKVIQFHRDAHQTGNMQGKAANLH